MISFATSLETILLLSLMSLHVGGTRRLKRNAGDGVAYAKLAVHKFRYLNLTTLMSASVKKLGECGKPFVLIIRCVSQLIWRRFLIKMDGFCVNCCQAIDTTTPKSFLKSRCFIT